MSFIGVLRNVTIGASVGVALVTALPFFGAVGAITATGTTVGSVGGGLAGFIDRISD